MLTAMANRVHTVYRIGMAKTRKITVTVPEDTAATLEQWREAGRISSVSEYVSTQIQAGMQRAATIRSIETVMGGRPELALINRARRTLGLPPMTEAEADAASAEAWATEPGAGAA